MSKKSLQIQQLDKKLSDLSPLKDIATPPSGWIKAIRTALGITLEQLGNKLGIAKSNVLAMEKREQSGSITLNSLQAAAEALDMKFVYALVPKDGSLEDLVDRKARELATYIVERSSQTMKLEDQENSYERIQKAIEERTQVLKYEMPKRLWD